MGGIRWFPVVLSAAIAPTLLCLGPAPASAQGTERVGLSISGAHYTLLGGDALDGLDPGFGFVAGARGAIGRSIVLGAGVRRTSHDVEGSDADGELWGIFGEARLIGFGHRAYPFGGVRVGYARKDFDAVGVRDSGAELAALVGLAVPLMPGLTLELAGVASYVLMDDSGSSLGLEAGLGFWFP